MTIVIIVIIIVTTVIIVAIILTMIVIPRFEEEEEFRSRGWASNYEVRLWPKDNISRRCSSSS